MATELHSASAAAVDDVIREVALVVKWGALVDSEPAGTALSASARHTKVTIAPPREHLCLLRDVDETELGAPRTAARLTDGSAHTWQLELGRAAERSALQRFLVDDATSAAPGAVVASAPSTARPGGGRRLTEEEVNEAARAETPCKPAPRAPPPDAVRITCCGSAAGTLFRQTHVDHCVASAAPAHLGRLFCGPIRRLVARAWEGEHAAVIEHWEPQRSEPATLLGQDAEIAGARTTVLHQLATELVEEARRRTNSVFRATIYASAVRMDGTAPTGAAGPRVTDVFAVLPAPLTGVVGTSSGPPATTASLLGRPRSGSADKSAATAGSDTPRRPQQRAGRPPLERHSAGTSAGGSAESNATSGTTATPVAAAAGAATHPRIVEVRAATTAGAERGSCAGEGSDVAAAMDCVVRGIRLVQLKDGAAVRLFVELMKRALVAAGDSPIAGSGPKAKQHMCVSLYVHQECDAVAPRTGVIRFFVMLPLSAHSALLLRERQLLSKFTAATLRGEWCPVPARWASHHTLLHLLRAATTVQRSHTLGIFHVHDEDAFSAVQHIADCGGYGVEVMIAQTYNDVQQALAFLMQRRGTLEREAAGLSEELDTLTSTCDLQRRNIARQERDGQDAFEASFACSSAMRLALGHPGGEENLLSASTSMTNSTTVDGREWREDLRGLTLTDLGAQHVEELGNDEGHDCVASASLPLPPSTQSRKGHRASCIFGLPARRQPGDASVSPGRGKQELALDDLEPAERDAALRFFALPASPSGDAAQLLPGVLRRWRDLTNEHVAQFAASTRKRQQLAQMAAQAEEQVAAAKERLAAAREGVETARSSMRARHASHPEVLARLRATIDKELATAAERNETVRTKIREGKSIIAAQLGPQVVRAATAAAAAAVAGSETAGATKDNGPETVSSAADGGRDAEQQCAPTSAASVAKFLRTATPVMRLPATMTLPQVISAHELQRRRLREKIEQERRRISILQADIDAPQSQLTSVHLPHLLRLFEFSALLHAVMRQYRSESQVAETLLLRGDLFDATATARADQLAAQLLCDPWACVMRAHGHDTVRAGASRLVTIVRDAISAAHVPPAREAELWPHQRAAELQQVAPPDVTARWFTCISHQAAYSATALKPPAAPQLTDTEVQTEDAATPPLVPAPPPRHGESERNFVPQAELRVRGAKVRAMQKELARTISTAAATARERPKPQPTTLSM